MSSSGEDSEPARHLAADSRQELATHRVKAQPVVAAFITSIVRDSHRADDLLQEVARISAVKFDEYDSSRAFTSWVTGHCSLRDTAFSQIAGAEPDHVFRL